MATNINATKLRNNLFDYLSQVTEYNDVLNVSTKRGNAVILSEEEYNSMVETLYLTSIPGMEERLQEGVNATLADCEEFRW